MELEQLLTWITVSDDKKTIDPDLRASDDLVRVTFKPSYRNNTFAVRAEFEALEPALEVSTYGVTAAVRDSRLGQMEARTMGYCYAQRGAGHAELMSRFSPGRQRGIYVAAVTLKMPDGNYKMWLEQHDFPIEVG